MIMPRIEIDLGKIAHNAKILKELYGSKGIDVIGVTKVVCGAPAVAKVLVKSGINILADSRIENIIKMHDADIHAQFLLLRTPLSQSESIVKYADISLNSGLSVIKELSKYAVKQGLTHKIILMVELGDLREGIMSSDLENTVNEVIGLKGIELTGIGTNLACFGAVALGASILERHFTDSMDRDGPDIVNSMDPEALSALISGSIELAKMRGGKKEAAKEEQVTIDFAFATVVTIKPIKKDEIFTKENIWVKRPGTGEINAENFANILGKVAIRDIDMDKHVSWSDINE